MEFPVDRARKRKVVLQKAVEANVPLDADLLEEGVNSNINREMKRQALLNPTLNPLDYLNDEDIRKADIIEASMRNIRAQNIQEATRVKIQEELSKTPSRERLRKWEAESLLQLQKTKSGGVR